MALRKYRFGSPRLGRKCGAAPFAPCLNLLSSFTIEQVLVVGSAGFRAGQHPVSFCDVLKRPRCFRSGSVRVMLFCQLPEGHSDAGDTCRARYAEDFVIIFHDHGALFLRCQYCR